MVIPSVANHPRDANTNKETTVQPTMCPVLQLFFTIIPNIICFIYLCCIPLTFVLPCFTGKITPSSVGEFAIICPNFLMRMRSVKNRGPKETKEHNFIPKNIQKPNISCEDRIPTPFHRTKTPAVGHSAVLLLRGASGEIHITKLEIFFLLKT